MIRENASAVLHIVDEAAKKSGRTAKDITVIGVTKTIDTESIKELIAAGVTNIGENRVQEFLPKYEALKNEQVSFHFIGHLQRNKVKFIIDKVEYIHSVDSIGLAEEIDKRAGVLGKKIKIFAEVNIANEPSKFGVMPKNVTEFIVNLKEFTNIEVVGLMCMPPMAEEPEENRAYFAMLRNFLVDINEKFLYYSEMRHLSMGMTGDFRVAIEEGATMVRIGSGFFGERG